jgi:hypothetical protein
MKSIPFRGGAVVRLGGQPALGLAINIIGDVAVRLRKRNCGIDLKPATAFLLSPLTLMECRLIYQLFSSNFRYANQRLTDGMP